MNLGHCDVNFMCNANSTFQISELGHWNKDIHFQKIFHRASRDHVKTFNCDCVVKHWTTKINQRNLVFLFQDAAAAANRDFKLISTFWRENVGSIMEMKLQTVLLLQCAFLPFLTLGLHVTNTNKTVKKEHLGKVRMKWRWNYKYLRKKSWKKGNIIA